MKTTWHYTELMSALREELKQYLAAVAAGPLTEEEERELREWVAAGYSVYENPDLVCDESGSLMSFIDGCRAAEELRKEYEDSLGRESAKTNVGWDADDDDMPFRY